MACYAPQRIERPRASADTAQVTTKENTMICTIAALLVILWLLGLVTSVTAGGLIHVLLVIAVVVVLLRIIDGRKPI